MTFAKNKPAGGGGPVGDSVYKEIVHGNEQDNLKQEEKQNQQVVFDWEQFGRELCEDQAVAFLSSVRLPPWLLVAISPDPIPPKKNPDITTITAENDDQARSFIRQWEGKRNLYFGVNPTRRAMTKKPE